MNASEFPSVPASFSQEFKPLFPLGQIVATPAVIAHFNEHHQSILPLLRRHVSGDWGELCAEDLAAQCDLIATSCRRATADYLPLVLRARVEPDDGHSLKS